jgi:hypothetical protein
MRSNNNSHAVKATKGTAAASSNDHDRGLCATNR